MRVRTRRRALLAGLAAAMVLPTAAAGAAPPTVSDTAKLRRDVSALGILGHEAALQAIAIGHEGTRVSGTSGYDASARYVADQARRAGLTVTRQDFTYPYGFPLGDVVQPKLQTLTPRIKQYDAGIIGALFGGDYGTAINSGGGDVLARVWAVDLVLPPGPVANSNTSGCEAGDFAGMPRGAIALMQRGTCGFAVKVANAAAAGAGAAILFNEGQPGRDGPLFADVSPDPVNQPELLAPLPTLTTPFALGSSLAGGVQNGRTPTIARVKAEWFTGDLPTSNVIAETKGGDPDSVVVVGAHLDSVGTGPGINDNGSGSAGILEIAEQLRGVKLRNKLRFVWFGAEESGLIGSSEYVASLPPEEQARISGMLNYDMIGSPNFVRFVYDGDLSDSPDPGPQRARAFGAPRLGDHRGRLPRLLRRQGPRDVADRVRRPRRTTARSSRHRRSAARASRPAGCSRAPRASRPRRRPPRTAVTRASRTTRATTSAATTSATSA